MKNDRKKSGWSVAVLLTVSITAAFSICPAFLPAAPPPAKPTAKSTKQTRQDTAKKAIAAFRRGKTLYGQKKYAEAATQFAAAARDFDAAGQALYAAYMYGWKGNCHRDAGDDEAAVRDYTESVRRLTRFGTKGIKELAFNASNLGKALKRLKRYDKAAKQFQVAADAYQANNDNVSAAWMYGRMGNSHRDAGDDVGAVKAYGESTRRFARLGKLGLKGLAMKARHLGKTLEKLKRFDEAVQALDQAAAARSELLGPKHYRTIDARLDLADLRQRAKLTDAQRKQLTEAGRQNGEAVQLGRQGKYSQALVIARKALRVRQDILGPQHHDTATSLNNLAMLYKSLGDYAKAEPLYRQALEIRKNALGENHPGFAAGLNNLALLYKLMGDYAKAEPLYRQALVINKKAYGENDRDYAASLNNLAELYHSMGAKAKAAPLYQQALEIMKKTLGENHPSYATSLNNLASLYHEMGAFAKAAPLYRQALKIQKKTLGEHHPSYANSLSNLAGLYLSMGDYTKAELLDRQASEIWRKALGENHPLYATSLSNLALLYRSRADYAKAEPLYRQVLAISRRILERTSLAQSERQQLAMGQMLRFRLDAYISLALRKRDIPQQAFREILLWKGATLVRQRQYRQVANEPAVAELFKKLQQVTMQLSSLARAFPAKPKQVTGWKARIAALTAEKEKLEAELSRKSAAFRKAKREITVADVAVALPKNAVLVDFLEYGRSTLSHKPGGKTVSYQRSLVASVLHPDGRVSLIDLGPIAVISQAIQTWRKTFGLSRQGMMAGRLLRKTVWDPLLPTIGTAKTVLVSPDGVLGRLPLGALPGKKPGTYLLEEYRLALIPVPQLLPALVNETGRKQVQKGLLLMGDVDYNASPGKKSLPVKQKRRSWRLKRSASVAAVRGGTMFGPLPNTFGEIASIKQLFRDVFRAGAEEITMLRQGSVTEARFRKLAPQFYYLHLATHGFFAPPEKKSALSGSAVAQTDRSSRGGVYDRRATAVQGFSPGLLSGLAFAGANRKPQPDGDDGILTATEIAFLPLDGVELVTLSACETGLGKRAGGEGLLGVQRAFQISGARSTVASLWKVPDLATRRLMERFYRNLWEKKMSRLDALREAQLWLLKHPEQLRGLTLIDKKQAPKQSPPYYWAAFQLSGDWR